VQIFPASVRACVLRTPQEFSEIVVSIHKIGEAGTVHVGMTVIRCRKIPVELMLWPLRTRRVDVAVVEAFALFGIPEQIVSARDLLELFFSRFVTRIKIRVQFFGQLAICLMDFSGRSRRGNTKYLVRISHAAHLVNPAPFPPRSTCA
jgi:hypothetical protein